MDSGIDFTVLNDFTPVIYEEPKIVDGALEVKFYYNTTPKKIYFKNSYVKEGNEWLILGITASFNKI